MVILDILDDEDAYLEHLAKKAGELEYFTQLLRLKQLQVRDIEDRKPGLVRTSQIYTCGICGDVFDKRYECFEHVYLELQLSEFTCEICKKDCVNKAGLLSHQKTHTTSELTITPNEGS